MYRKLFKYNYPQKIYKKFLSGKSDYDILELSWSSAFKTKYEENNRSYSILYRPRCMRRNKSVIVVPGLRSTALCERGIAIFLAKNGFDCYIFMLPYHHKRTPRGYKNGELFLSTDLFLSGSALLQSIKEIRALADLCEGEKVGIIGISLGGFLTHILMGVDNRFKAGIAISSGGNLNRILWEGFVGIAIKRLLRGRGVEDRDYIKTLEKFNNFIEDAKRDIWRKPDFPWFLIDPLTYAHLNHPRNVVMFNGIIDPVIPLKAVLGLWSAIGKPKLFLLPAGHLLVYPFYLFIIFYSINFFKRNL